MISVTLKCQLDTRQFRMVLCVECLLVAETHSARIQRLRKRLVSRHKLIVQVTVRSH